MRNRSRHLIGLTAAILAAALSPAAGARPLYEAPGSSFTADTPTFTTAAPQPAAQAGPGFQWDDAGLGAAGTLVLVGVGSGAAVAVRRRGGRPVVG